MVSVMANWFGKGKRGLIMGIWNAHTSVGNIVGSLLAAYMLQYGWGWSFIAPGLFIIVCGEQAVGVGGGCGGGGRARLASGGGLRCDWFSGCCCCWALGCCWKSAVRLTEPTPTLPAPCPPAAGMLIFSFLVVEPQDIGFLPQSGSVIGSRVRPAARCPPKSRRDASQ